MNGNTAISRKVVGEKCARDNPERYMGSSDYQYTVPDNVAVELSFVAFLYHFQTESMTSRAIVPIFFEEQWTQNHQQYLSGWSRALFPTTFLETAVYEMTHIWWTPGKDMKVEMNKQQLTTRMCLIKENNI